MTIVFQLAQLITVATAAVTATSDSPRAAQTPPAKTTSPAGPGRTAAVNDSNPIVRAPTPPANEAATSRGAAAGFHNGFAVVGLYPLWEGTAWLVPHRRGVLTTSHAEFGIANRLQVGLRPDSLSMRVPNGHVKMALPMPAESLWVAVDVGAFVILPGAAESYFSNSYPSRLDAIDHSVYALPASLNLTWQPAPWVALHNTLTALTVTGRAPVRTRLSVGNFATAEVSMKGPHSFLAHAGNIGLWEQELWVVGASYRYASQWLEMRLGYVYRGSRAGMQRHPLFSAGILL